MTIKTAHLNCLSLILSTFKMRVTVYNVHLITFCTYTPTNFCHLSVLERRD